MRRQYAIPIFCSLIAATSVSAQPQRGPLPVTQQGDLNVPPDAVGVFLSFGWGLTEGRTWDGALSLSGGTIHALQGWRLYRGDGVPATDRWTIRTAPTNRFSPGWYPMPDVQPPYTYPKGVVAYVSGGAQARVSVTTAQGDFAFTLGRLAA